MLTSIVIITFNKLDFTKQCIQSIREYTEKGTYELIVVDNSSVDGTIDWLREQSDIKAIFNVENMGFPKGCNQGIRESSGENILLLNNDVVVTPNWLSNLQRALYSSEDIAASGPITNYCSNYQAITVNYNDINQMQDFARNFNISDPTKWELRCRLVGFCLLIKKSVLDRIGVLDEIFTPGNYEDDDLCLRMRLEGYKLILCKDTFIHHYGSVSFGESRQNFINILQTNANKFQSKWGESLIKDFYSTTGSLKPSSNVEIKGGNKEVSQEGDILDFEQNNVVFTGERLVINKDVKQRFNNVLQEHIKRYELACKFVQDKKVLDAACGAGYGAKMLELAGAKQVIGIDISSGSIESATVDYSSDKTSFLVGDVNKLPFEDESFDVVVSFETIEHISDGTAWINEAFRVLKSKGIFIVSTPNRIMTNPGLFMGEKPLNIYHTFEYSLNEFIGELLKKYDIMHIFGQTFIHNTKDYATMTLRQVRGLDMAITPKENELIYGYDLVELGDVKNTQPVYMVAVCRKKKLKKSK